MNTPTLTFKGTVVKAVNETKSTSSAGTKRRQNVRLQLNDEQPQENGGIGLRRGQSLDLVITDEAQFAAYVCGQSLSFTLAPNA
jgi:hypothetical protein